MQEGRSIAELTDLEGNVVGHIHDDQNGKPVVQLGGTWQFIADAINHNVQKGHSLETPDHRLHRINGCSDTEVTAVIHAIRVLSERRLRVKR